MINNRAPKLTYDVYSSAIYLAELSRDIESGKVILTTKEG